ncbi:MAG: ATP-dependent DNA helicase RecG [Gammaproteobacteria bacterium]|nr:ATP-dependent DNA helicase RecG [Gammaproteobacteria bacterium]
MPGAPLSQTPCSTLTGVGPQLTKKLQKLEIHSLLDLLLHLPFRYEDRTKITPLNKLTIGQHTLIEGMITHTESTFGYKKNFICYISDTNSNIAIRLLHFNPKQKYFFKEGATIRAYGEVRWGKNGPEMVHPEYKIYPNNNPEPVGTTYTPTYPITAGITQTIIRKLMRQALAFLAHNPLPELLPEYILEQNNYPELTAAITFIHAPDIKTSQLQLEGFQHPTQQRLIFTELLAYQLAVLEARVHAQQHCAIQLTASQALYPQLLETLPFELTNAQNRAIKEIQTDLNRTTPMLRLLQGDVGSGKTIVALAAILQCIENNKQAAIMAPTEILAEQHFQNFTNLLPTSIGEISWLSGKVTGKTRQDTLQKIANGTTKIIVGTHAMFQAQVKFADLALIIVDEQHRFGVHQRLALREKGANKNLFPHQLIMTATPIPRTIAMLAYADLDCSVIDELPKGRKPITTINIANSRRAEIITKVRALCNDGQQAYWVCPLIAESENLQCEAAETTAKTLQQELPELNIGLIHGRMPPAYKQEIMHNFKNGTINLLVATTVIEVGVDVSNASLMIIENAERLGLAQLHQLRGRVGRGNIASFCVLLYQSPLSQTAKERLQIMRETNDGFKIAQKDLEIRGPGELLGSRQTGLLQLRIADLTRDSALITKAQDIAHTILNKHPDIVKSLLEIWIGKREKYANA